MGYFLLVIFFGVCGIASLYGSRKFKKKSEEPSYAGLSDKHEEWAKILRWTGYWFITITLIMSPWIFLTTIPAGHVGVLTFFGKVYDQVPEGLNLVNPLANVTKMSVRTQEKFEESESPSREGLNVHLETSLLYHLDPKVAWEVFRDVGPEYAQILVAPQLRSAIRGETVKHDAKDLYTSGREVIASGIEATLKEELNKRGIIVERVLLRRIQLPTLVADAISAKMQADQDAQRMEFILAKEKQEAKRKEIEAQGIATFQNIVTQGISEQLLRWKGIEATQQLANSNNTKIVIVGGKDGLPLILNSGK